MTRWTGTDYPQIGRHATLIWLGVTELSPRLPSLNTWKCARATPRSSGGATHRSPLSLTNPTASAGEHTIARAGHYSRASRLHFPSTVYPHQKRQTPETVFGVHISLSVVYSISASASGKLSSTSLKHFSLYSRASGRFFQDPLSQLAVPLPFWRGPIQMWQIMKATTPMLL